MGLFCVDKCVCFIVALICVGEGQLPLHLCGSSSVFFFRAFEGNFFSPFCNVPFLFEVPLACDFVKDVMVG